MNILLFICIAILFIGIVTDIFAEIGEMTHRPHYNYFDIVYPFMQVIALIIICCIIGKLR